MIARGNLRHDPAEFFMCGDLRRDFAGKQFFRAIIACAQDRDGGLIARSFKRQYCFHNKQNTRVILSQAKDLTKADGSHSVDGVTLSAYGRSLDRSSDLEMTALISLLLQLSARSVARKS